MVASSTQLLANPGLLNLKASNSTRFKAGDAFERFMMKNQDQLRIDQSHNQSSDLRLGQFAVTCSTIKVNPEGNATFFAMPIAVPSQ